MQAMDGLKCALVALALIGAGPIAALAATPTPSPALEGILAPPPDTTFVELDKTAPGAPEGPFDADQYIALGANSEPARVKATLARFGFIAGYARTWVQKGINRVLVEAVVAFTGGEGAKKWLLASEVADKGDASYRGPLSIVGIEAYYGAHFFISSASAYADEISFVKGNDYYIVATVAQKDEAGAAAVTQATKQYELAPDATVPKDQWPESSSSAGVDAGGLTGHIAFIALVLFVLGVVLRLFLRSRRAPAVASAGTAAALNLSPDGRYWWDGHSWKDAEHEVPPTAQRSGDGRYWWDGRAWRPVPPT